ncbi:MAG: methionyl-tRNA formyltransferase [Chloroflexota bacterium]|nr:methionyl-tRNA formyltransferase [Chloroflexota bacterium]
MGERVIFMGTPQFAVPSLERLREEYEVAAVVTRPDKVAGRGRKISFAPVKEVALAWGIPVMQPRSLKEKEVVTSLLELEPQVIVVAAYGLILPPEVLVIPPFGCLNVHASLLPKYRGASPVAGALLAGEEETGITIILMDEGMDTGPILAQAQLPIAPEDNRGSLTEKLAYRGADLLLETLPRWLKGEITPQPQEDDKATYTKMLKKEDGLIDWSKSSVEIWRRVRAYNPWPGAYTEFEGRTLKILRARRIGGERGEPGLVVATKEGAAVVTGEGLLALEEVQLAGKRAMGITEFLRGQRGIVGSRLG